MISEEEFEQVEKPKRKYKKKEKTEAKEKKEKKNGLEYDHETNRLSLKYPDSENLYYPTQNEFEISKESQLTIISTQIQDTAPITGMSLSPNGYFLATFCNAGSVCIWDANTFEKLQSLTDDDEGNIDEFYCGQWAQDSTTIITGGKLKDHKKWSIDDDDNHLMPCPMKVFDVVSGKVVNSFHGHQEEILSITVVNFKDEIYLLSTSQDGYILKWKTNEHFTELVEKTKFEDGVTCMAFGVSILPNTGSKYLIASCDDSIKLYDFESAKVFSIN
jgi:WD40 repeat protein